MRATAAAGEPAVKRSPPHLGLLRRVNPVFTRILRSRLHGLLDRGFQPPLLLLTVTGRRTGRRYTIVVGRHDVDGVPTIFTAMPWRVTLRGGADVDVTYQGVRTRARAVLVEEPGTVADAYAAVIRRIGWRAARRQLALKVSARRPPTRAELIDAVTRDGLSVIRLHQP